MQQYTTINAQVDNKRKTLKMPIKSTDIVPRYLYYLMEYHKIPHTYTIILADKRFKNIDEFINEEK